MDLKVEMKQWELWPFFGCFFIFENTWIFIEPEIQVVSLDIWHVGNDFPN